MTFQSFDFARADVRARLAALSLEVKLLRWAHALRRVRWDRKDSDHDAEGPDDDDGPRHVWGSVQYAQNFPNDHNGPPEPVDDGDPPDPLPEERPTEVGELSRVLRYASSLLSAWVSIAALAQATPWIMRYGPEIVSNNDPPKTFDQLTESVGISKAGYQDHHIVEQTSAARDGFSREMINGKGNVVKVPTLKHREITAWYGARNPEFGGLTPREYLSGRPWEERYAVGIQQLIQKGILKP
ncbi:MAG: hypothetical protein JWN07_1675 [Hyphomicrobiales bacterium]|nr:hypothetical protein [Hyphomicrobiales bacterium]